MVDRSCNRLHPDLFGNAASKYDSGRYILAGKNHVSPIAGRGNGIRPECSYAPD